MRNRGQKRSNHGSSDDEEKEPPDSKVFKSKGTVLEYTNQGRFLKQTPRKTEKKERPIKENTKRDYDATTSVRCDSVSGIVPSNLLSAEEPDATDLFWEDGIVPVSNLNGDRLSKIEDELTVEFDDLPSSSQRKSFQRASAKDKELAELVHKVHLLCLLSRGRLVDRACNDPLIQVSLLSMLPVELLKISNVSKLTANLLSPIVKWFHYHFQVQHTTSKEDFSRKSLAFALGTHEGTSEEVVALSVSLFRALNIPARFVSILDTAPLKPEICITGSSQYSGSSLDTRVSLLTKQTVNHDLSSSYPPKSLPEKNSKKGTTPIKSKTNLKRTPNRSRAVERLADEFPESLTIKTSKNNEYTGCVEGIKRKGDLEFDLQLEMALSATEAAVNDNGISVTVNDSSASLHQTPSKKLKTKKSVQSPVSKSGDQGIVWSRKSGPPLYWSEVYCNGENLTGRWVHVDVINSLIDGEQQVESASAACRRPLRYVVAFARNGAKDVTRRYCTQWYKIAPHRVLSKWWDAVLAPLKELESREIEDIVRMQERSNSSQEDINRTNMVGISNKIGVKACASLHDSFPSRTSLEDMELEIRSLTEPLPTNQQAYRSHPLYIIERWVTKYQILHPKGPVLGFCSGHPVYPRTCVQTLQTKQRWLREAMQVKPNEVPSKVVKSSSKPVEAKTYDGPTEEDDHANIELYGKWQMEPLCLPHAVNGIVPKNERGQVDVWSEKCLPPGTIHLRLPRLVPVVNRLGINFAPAMVGFEFLSGRSIPVFDGIVVCTEFREAILTAYGEEEERREIKERKWNESQAVLRWYQLISSMVTRQRLRNSYEGSSSFQSQLPSTKQPPRTVIPQKTITGDECGRFQEEEKKRVVNHHTSSSYDSHEHVFPLEDQSYDEESSIRIKKCPCGFSIEMEEM
ncbi:hypothetical protein ZOSMA_38G00270 [Zostera marina]|uniref:DNA repair protein RAD4 n=1 Tax=Zostera marina TaxID=29655 RepID=A0A0K9P6U8_ZOSMR|nr:hypothetical protein ZOSMA_38G00270 [Zostera marina]